MNLQNNSKAFHEILQNVKYTGICPKKKTNYISIGAFCRLFDTCIN